MTSRKATHNIGNRLVDGIAIGCNSLSAIVPADEQILILSRVSRRGLGVVIKNPFNFISCL
jgi:hypothetical protein